MATRTAYPGTQAAADVLTSANVSKLPGGWIGFVEITADVGSIGTSATDVTGLTLTVTVNTSRKIRISQTCGLTDGTGSANVAATYVTNGSNTVIGAPFQANVPASNTLYGTGFVVVNPASGSNTWKLRGNFTVGAANSFAASAILPAQLLIEDIGPSA